MSEYFETDECAKCPKCGHSGLLYGDCPEITCQHGYIDESDEDYCLEGTIMVKCSECKGTGLIIRCPACGADLSGQDVLSEEDSDYNLP